MKNERGVIGVAILLFVIFAAIAGLFYFGVMKGNLLYTTDPNLNTTKKFDEQMQQTTPAIVPSSNIDTSNWKTYTNKYSNYSIKYPPDGQFIDCDGHCNYDAQLDTKDLHSAFVSEGYANKTLITDPTLYTFCSTKQPSPIQIEGVTFYLDTKTFAQDNICAEYVTKLSRVSFQSNPDTTYWTLSIQTRAKNDNGVKLRDRILSTFQFTD